MALAAPPVDGEANEELIRFLASATGLPKSAITIASGAASRIKLIDFAGIDAATLRDRLLTASRKPARK